MTAHAIESQRGYRRRVSLTRRSVLAAAVAAAAAAACSAAPTPISTAPGPTPTPTAPGPTPTRTPTTSPTPTPTPTKPSLPRATTWKAGAGEVQPAVKTRACQFIEAICTWTNSTGDIADARARAKAAGFTPQLADALAPLLGVGTSAVANVRHAHYGGILDTTASVLVVVDQWRAMPDETVHVGGSTVDVRLEQASPHWRVVDAFPAEIERPDTTLSSTAQHVLANTRIRLPYAAHADVNAGKIRDSVLIMLGELATSHVIDVAVLRSGHPLHVFGTDRMSDHPLGRAADLWAIDHHDIVDPANYDLTASVMRNASQLGAYQVGGPVLLDGSGFFSDNTHQDHIHVGFNY